MKRLYRSLIVGLTLIHIGNVGSLAQNVGDSSPEDDEPSGPPIWTQCPGAGCPAGHGTTPEDMLRAYNDGRYSLDEFDIRRLQGR